MCKRLSDKTKEAILSGLEALAHGAYREIVIPLEAETIHLSKIGHGQCELTIIRNEGHRPVNFAERLSQGDGLPERHGYSLNTRKGPDRRAAITRRRLVLGGSKSDRKKGENLSSPGRSRVARRTRQSDRRTQTPKGLLRSR